MAFALNASPRPLGRSYFAGSKAPGRQPTLPRIPARTRRSDGAQRVRQNGLCCAKQDESKSLENIKEGGDQPPEDIVERIFNLFFGKKEQ
jgi:hypothetical protein